MRWVTTRIRFKTMLANFGAHCERFARYPFGNVAQLPGTEISVGYYELHEEETGNFVLGDDGNGSRFQRS